MIEAYLGRAHRPAAGPEQWLSQLTSSSSISKCATAISSASPIFRSRLPAGKVVALLGSNGAGKTTTLNAIAGLVPSGARQYRYGAARRSSGQPAYAIVSKGLALSPEGWRLFVSQTVEQNLRLGATALADRSRTAALFERVYALFPRLAERRRQQLPARCPAASGRCSRSAAR